MDEHQFPPIAEIVCVSSSFVFGRPMHTRGALHVEREASGEYWARNELTGARALVETRRIAALWAALQLPALAERDPAQFEVDVSRHYDSMWTDDSPDFGLRLRCDDGRVFAAQTRSQHWYMIPWDIYRDGQSQETHDIRLARAIAGILPEGFVNQHRISGAGLYDSVTLDQTIHAKVEREMAEAEERSAQPEKTPTPDEEVLRAADGPPLSFDFLNNADDDAAGVTAEAEEPTQWVLEQRLDEGGSPNAADENGQTALMLAAFPPFNEAKFKLLVARGADVNARRNDGMTGLQLAGGSADVAQAWIDAGADVNLATPHGSTALMLFAGWPDVVAVLLAAGADPNLQDDDGDTVGTYLMEEEHRNEPWRLTILDMLFAAGLRAELRNKAGQTLADHITLWERRQDLEDRVRAEIVCTPGRTWRPWRPLRTGWSALARLVAQHAAEGAS